MKMFDLLKFKANINSMKEIHVVLLSLYRLQRLFSFKLEVFRWKECFRLLSSRRSV